MESAITLLQSAISLLMLLNSATGPVPEELRIQATNMANYAILVATKELDAGEPTATESVSKETMTTKTATTGSTTSKADITVTSLGDSQLSDTVQVGSQVSIGVVLYSDDGTYNRDAGVTMTAPDEAQNKTIRYANTKNGRDPRWFYHFMYVPNKTGDHTITFTGAGLTKTLTIKTYE